MHVARRNGYGYSYLATANPHLSGTHRLQLRVTGLGPVQLALLVDDNPILDVVDSSPSALTGPGTTGLFAYQGAGSAFESFLATQP